MSDTPATGRDILVTTTNDVPGYRDTRVLGEVMGLTLRNRNFVSQVGAGFEALAGGELKGMAGQVPQAHDSSEHGTVGSLRILRGLSTRMKRVGMRCEVIAPP